MASFFIPGGGDPAANCTVGGFQIYCNTILPAERRFGKTYQVINLALGATALVVPIAMYLIYLLMQCRSRPKPERTRSSKPNGHTRKTSDTTLSGIPLVRMNPPSFRSTKSFRIMSDVFSDAGARDDPMNELVIFPTAMRRRPSMTSLSSLGSVASNLSEATIPAQMRLDSIDIDSLGADGFAADTFSLTMTGLMERSTQFELTGFAVRCSIATDPALVAKVVDALYDRHIPSILLCSHDWEALATFPFDKISGIIVENACILVTGERRDYFQSAPLRRAMLRCAQERESREEFFVGYLDQWLHRPHPSVVKRAVKLAEHYGAVLEHGPYQPSSGFGASDNAARTIGGLDYLRRTEIVELQGSWTSESRPVCFSDTSDENVRRFPFERVEQMVPGATQLLSCNTEVEPAGDTRELHHPPQYIHRFAGSKIDFWATDQNGHPLAAKGCVPLGSEPTSAHYKAVVTTQLHLRKLNMLHAIGGGEEQALLGAFRSLSAHPDCHSSVHELIDSIRTRRVRIYQGLHTGFRVPDGDERFWGVYNVRDASDPSGIDIFISLQSPNEAAVILHTWLGVQGATRIERFEQEVLLESVTGLGHSSGLPSSIRTSLEAASTSELLVTVQKVNLARSNHRMAKAIVQFAHFILLEKTSNTKWANLCALKALDGTIPMGELLELRLAHLKRMGATRLPPVANLLRLHDSIEDIMLDALYFGWHDVLHQMTKIPLHSYGRAPAPDGSGEQVDVAADLFALIYFSALRRAAFEDVYLESTDRCPLYLSQPDQAAVFSELWTLGSQCENYFGLVPREIGDIIYHRRVKALAALGGPTAADRPKNEIMTMYADTDGTSKPDKPPSIESLTEVSSAKLTPKQWIKVWQLRFATAGAMSIFCMPAIIDMLLLTFLGRGLFLTAFMHPHHVQAAGYAVLTSLLLTAGVTGWVGSGGSHYLPHYAYDNVIYFHIQRLSGGFVLAVLTSIFGCLGFSLTLSVSAGFVFAAYMMAVSTYLNLLGVMSTMHQNGSPLSSGRNAFLQSFGLLFLSPLLSSLVNFHDLAIYLPIMYSFLLLTLYRYRRLCREWSTWMTKIPSFKSADILEWYNSRLATSSSFESATEESEPINEKNQSFSDPALEAQNALKAAIDSYNRGDATFVDDPFVAKVSTGMPYIDWLFKRASAGTEVPVLFSTAWFAALTEAISNQHQLARGLKDHNVLTLFRLARYDIGQNLGLFLVALLDRWITIVMSARKPYPSIYTDMRARYGLALCIIYFCLASLVIEATLSKYWSIRDTLSEEKLRDAAHAAEVAAQAKTKHRACYHHALVDLFSKLVVVFGVMTVGLWLFVDSKETHILFYLYCLGYTCCILFQFNRCFTKNVGVHIQIVLYSAIVFFIIGCILHALPWTAPFFYSDIIVMNCAAISSAIGTTFFVYKDWFMRPSLLSEPGPSEKHLSQDPVINFQRRVLAPPPPVNEDLLYMSNLPAAFTTPTIWDADGTRTSEDVNGILSEALYRTGRRPTNKWMETLLHKALEMWAGRRLVIAVLSREHFAQAGFSDCASLSFVGDRALHITVCFNAVVPTNASTLSVAGPPGGQLGQAIAEAIVYHVSHVTMGFSVAQSIHAECLLDDITGILSTRIDAELTNTTDAAQLSLCARRSWADLTKYLCLGVSVDTEWDELPPDVRRIILSRLQGRSCPQSNEFIAWASRIAIPIDTLNFHVRLALEVHLRCVQQRNHVTVFAPEGYGTAADLPAELKPAKLVHGRRTPWHRLARIPVVVIKWVAILSGGGSNVERELAYLLRNTPGRKLILPIVLGLWKLCWHAQRLWISWLVLSSRPSIVHITRLASKGNRRKIAKNLIIVEHARGTTTGFASEDGSGAMCLKVYNGTPTEVPEKDEPLFIATYDNDCRLISRLEKGGGISTYTYYPSSRSRRPIKVSVVNSSFSVMGRYDARGRVVTGTLTIGGVDLRFHYHYKAGVKGSTTVLRADFKAEGSGDTLSVCWGKPADPDDCSWVPTSNVGLIIRRIGAITYSTEYDFSHRRDPVATTYLQDQTGTRRIVADAPKVYPFEGMLLKPPTYQSFEMDDLLLYHSTLQINWMRRDAAVGKWAHTLNMLNPIGWLARWRTRVYTPVPTWRIGTELWNKWLKTNSVDAVTACTVDELILRKEPLLRDYWRARDQGRLEDAREALDSNITQIVSAIDIETDVSEKTLLAIRTSHLYAMGLGKDANAITTRPQDCFSDTKERVSIIFNDIGCWPVAPGGVSNCRRDLVNGHSTIRNHVLAECANDYGIPRFQVEKNVQSLKLLPLWGLDGGTANHGLIDNILESQVDAKVEDTDHERDIVGTFIPLLTQYVKGCRTKRLSYAQLIELSNVFLSMANYYEHKDYTRTWRSEEVEQAWVAAWLRSYDDPNIVEPTECFHISRPSMFDFRQALNIVLAYFFIFSVGIPERCPRVFQSTHHGISSLFGMVLKYRRGVTLGIWDHAILWRESCLNFSVAQCELSVAVQNMLLSGVGVACRLAYLHADVIMPCASLFNPMWEAELGSDGNRMCSRQLFKRKIDPIVNGISDMDGYQPVDKIRTEIPTVVMLSNVQFIKGVKTAIQAADVIVNRFGFKDYKLVVYGAKDRQPAYALEMERLIVEKNLSNHVVLAGFGNSKEVLKDAWLFMNSSLSEGLPLAIGEAALAGVPIVATEVGATALVLTDPDDSNQRYGEVVPPNDPTALARAQISMLAMVGPWAKFASPDDIEPGPSSAPPPAGPVLPDVVTAEDVEWLTKRFYVHAEDRRKLGYLSRQVVLRSFHGSRYIREHEQMYWIQWHLARMRADPTLKALPFKFGIPERLRYDINAESAGPE